MFFVRLHKNSFFFFFCCAFVNRENNGFPVKVKKKKLSQMLSDNKNRLMHS